jgi:heptaprenyl diphosphate synthase
MELTQTMQFTHGAVSEQVVSDRLVRAVDWGMAPGHRAAVDALLVDAVLRSAPTLAGPAARVLSGGKRLRPAVTIAAAGWHDADTVAPPALAGASAVELLHWATLVHDDVMDGARTRHGQPTVNAREGVGQAIVTGDLLIAAAFELGTRVGADTVRCLAQTLADLCVGQTREDSHRFDAGVDEDDVLAVASGKTGSLLSAAACIGGQCAAADAPVLDALTEFGMAFGISLQLLDDLLDLVSSPELLGKPVGSDFVNGTITLPAVVSMRANPGLLEFVRPGLPADDADRALDLLRNPEALRHCLRQARHHAERAGAILAGVADAVPGLDALARWPVAYLDEQLATKVTPSWRPLLETARIGRRFAV